ncbi:hypothetical protein FCI23_03805 [Actinacidiphila oryziradicis]|uniref:Uncharacterized protein n=1 Tax=Actinacidiphila oryziradicis TaxID=2571141 RepID=A0A4U0SWL3_9ACTN|nr:hypothetical protein FCI23_03805 [Actinacidiphila oryziradicis]
MFCPTDPHGSGSTRYFPGGAADTEAVLPACFESAPALFVPLPPLHPASAATASTAEHAAASSPLAVLPPDRCTDLAPSAGEPV